MKLRRRLSRSGFSIIEMVLVLAIASFLFVKASQFFIVDVQKGDLIASRDMVVNFIQRARSLAQVNSQYVAVTFQSKKLTMYQDTNKSGTMDGSEMVHSELNLRGDVQLLEGCGNNAASTTLNSSITFNQFSFAGTVASSVFTKKSLQVFIYHPKLPLGSRTREVEILSSGLVEKILDGQSGYVSVNARQANFAGVDCGTP